MVKGTSKRIVVVKSPNPRVFEQAIFVVREDFFGHRGRADALKEAQQVANEYVRSAVAAKKRPWLRLTLPVWIAIGAGVAGLAALALWLLL